MRSAVRCGRQVAAVNRRAAGGVRDQRPITEQLRQQLDVGRLAAAGAGAGELEERLEQLHVLHVRWRSLGAVGFGNGQEEIPVRRFGFAQRRACGAMLIALCFGLRFCSWPGRPSRTKCNRCNLRARLAGCIARPSNSFQRGFDGLERGRRVAEVASARRPSRESVPRADRPARTSRIGCTSPPPRPGFPARCCASPTAPWRSGTCRRRGTR